MRFWRKKGETAGDRDTGKAGKAPPFQPDPATKKPSRPRVTGTKIRLFLQPPGRTTRLLELDLPNDVGEDGATLRCFEPPPEGGQGGGQSESRAWVVEVDQEQMAAIRARAEGIRLLPLGGRSSSGDGSTVELTISSGPAEARLTWWMAPPSGWADAAQLVQDLRRLSGEEL
jgi:hypothetical protein